MDNQNSQTVMHAAYFAKPIQSIQIILLVEWFS
jgi:hypothetical protein